MGNGNILVVDDTPVNLQLLDDMLSDEGFDVRTAISGEGALRSVEAELPDIILLDVMMPGLNGYETCRRLKEDKRSADIPVVFLSAKNDSESVVEGFKAGGVDYVGKPFNRYELLSRVRTHLALHMAQRQILAQNKELEISRYHLQKNFEVMNEHIIFAKTDGNGNFIEVSDAFCREYDYTREELIGNNNKILKCEDTPNEIYQELWSTLKMGQIWKGELKNRKKDGSEFWVEGYIEPLYNYDGSFLCYSAIYYDINDKKRIELLSVTDQLTNLYNRRYFENAMPLEFKRASRNNSKLIFMELDIDFFKQYNDTYGHQEGDKVLELTAKALKKVLSREEDIVFRLGGEEFGAVCRVDSMESAEIMAEKVRDAIEGMNIPHSGSKVAKVVTASIGVVYIDFEKATKYLPNIDEMYRIADVALYEVKKEQRNGVRILSYCEEVENSSHP